MRSPDKSFFALDEAGLVQRVNSRFGTHGQQLLSAYRKGRPDASPTDIAVAIESAAFAGAGSVVIAERKADQQRAPVFMYVMNDHINATVPGTNYQLGAMHAMDIRLKFDNVALAEERQPSLTPEERADHELAAKNMSRMWAAFARTSQPAAAGQPNWPAYDPKTRATMIIGPRCHVAYDPYPAEREAWAEIV
jgi:para-nitrobenzyl esterase